MVGTHVHVQPSGPVNILSHVVRPLLVWERHSLGDALARAERRLVHRLFGFIASSKEEHKTEREWTDQYQNCL